MQLPWWWAPMRHVPCKLLMQPMSLPEAARRCLGGSLAGAGGTACFCDPQHV